MTKHLSVLDGLRGTAAVSVVMFHFQELSIGMVSPNSLWLRHANLAVDFFFCLSGYVIGYAYDRRRDEMGILRFFRARLIRLHPLVVFGVALGLAAYVFDPFNAGATVKPFVQSQHNAPTWKIVAAFVLGALMLPTWPLPNRFKSYVPLNPPGWSLMWEYLANIAFALVLWRARRFWLTLIVALAAIAIVWVAKDAGALSVGFRWGQMLPALVRTTFSFGAGLLLFRYGVALRSPFGFVSLSLLMLVLFCLPTPGWTWAYEAAVVILVFPLIVALGAGAQSAGANRICLLAGRLSYPIYMVHYGFVMLYANYRWSEGMTLSATPWVIATMTAVVLLFAYGVLVLYDEPMRRWLANKAQTRATIANSQAQLSERTQDQAPAS
jgi:peptidoglycan/LPS O-acetylase OafA/YrhL